MYKNVASQKLAIFLYNTTTGAGVTGDAANITGQISKDGGASAASNDTNPTELDATNHPGIYLFDLTQAETNADLISFKAASATAGVRADPVIIYTQIKLTAGATNTIQADVIAINGQLTNANNATLYLKALNVSNSAGTAVIFESTGGSGDGFAVYGHDIGAGFYANGGTAGPGIFADGGVTGGSGMMSRANAGNYHGFEGIKSGAGKNFQGASEIITDYKLDRLLAADAPVGSLTSGSIFSDLLNDDSGTWRFSSNTLELAPGGWPTTFTLPTTAQDLPSAPTPAQALMWIYLATFSYRYSDRNFSVIQSWAGTADIARATLASSGGTLTRSKYASAGES